MAWTVIVIVALIISHLSFDVSYPGVVIVLEEPVDRLFEGWGNLISLWRRNAFVFRTFLEWGEFEVADQAQQFLVRSWLPELSIGTSGIKLPIPDQPQYRLAREWVTVYSPPNPTALTIASATSLMLTSSSSPTLRGISIRARREAMVKTYRSG